MPGGRNYSSRSSSQQPSIASRLDFGTANGSRTGGQVHPRDQPNSSGGGGARGSPPSNRRPKSAQGSSRGSTESVVVDYDVESSVYISVSPAFQWRSVDRQHFTSWLENKCRGGVRIVKTLQRPNGMITVLGNKQQVAGIMRINGYSYGPQKLQVVIKENSESGGDIKQIAQHLTTPDSIALLRDFVQSRYNAELKLCDLSNLASVPLLMQKLQTLDAGAFNALFKILADNSPDLQTLILAHNQLKSLSPIAGISAYLPNLPNLSLAQNDIISIKSIEDVLGGKNGHGGLKQLRELLLSGNPIAHDNDQVQNLRYRLQIGQALSQLHILDTVPIERQPQPLNVHDGSQLQQNKAQRQSAQQSVQLPLQQLGSFFDTELTQQTAGQFLQKYLHLFDTDRMQLLDVYAADVSQFSLSIIDQVTAKVEDTIKTESESSLITRSSNRQKANEWIANNHNLKFISSGSTVDTLQIGPLNIVHALGLLPQTAHDFSVLVSDCWQTPAQTASGLARLHIRFSGIYTEVQSKLKRHYDRCFVLIPAPVESKAFQTQSWPVQIVNDMLCIRPALDDDIIVKIQERFQRQAVTHGSRGRGGRYQRPSASSRSSLKMVDDLSIVREVAKCPPVIAASSPSSSAQPQPTVNENTAPQLSPEQMQLAQQFSQHTNLNLEFSVLCLNEQSWDPQRALQAFEQAKALGRIPPQAFMQKQ
ncbi:hypothetical protein MP228_012256 [Amoeboaphelidium protococcarum]|nr:hypothetical protein MP228_012256 [Amoeboaphelidium protococcarum]